MTGQTTRPPAGNRRPRRTEQESTGEIVRHDPSAVEQPAALARFEGRKDVVLLHPVTTFDAEATSAILTMSAAEIRISTDESRREVYHDWRFAKKADGKAALTGFALDKIAQAAGVDWIHSQTGEVPGSRIFRENGHVYFQCQAIGAVRQLNGEVYAIKEFADFDSEVEEAEVRYAKVNYNESSRRSGSKKTDAEIDDDVHRDMIRLRKFAFRSTISKAKYRVVRRLLGIPQVWDVGVLDRCALVVPRVVLRPEAMDDVTVERMRAQALDAASSVYGQPSGAPALPSAVDPTIVDVPAGVDSDTGEIVEGEEVEQPELGAGDQDDDAEEGEVVSVGDEPVAAESEFPKPEKNPKFSDGPHADHSFEFVAGEDPGYLRDLIHFNRLPEAWVEIARGWLLFMYGEGGDE